jgi:hypothetical protein
MLGGHQKSGCLAQLGEHRPYKAGVGGSSPSASTITSVGGVAKRPNADDCKSFPNGFGGSNPSSSTILLLTLGYSQAVRHQTLTLASPWFKSTYPSHLCDPLAQSAEQLAFNQWVEGSIPLRVTISLARVAEQVDAQDLKS